MIRHVLYTLFVLLSMSVVQADEIVVDHAAQEHLAARHGAGALWDYHFAADDGVPYIHPLSSTNGMVLTEFAPPDHVWHRGLWFSWKFINCANYWEFKDRKTPVWEGQTRTIGNETVERGSEGVAIATRISYSHDEEMVLTENRRIEAKNPDKDGAYTLDWLMTFTATGSEQVVLDRTPPSEASWGGYAGLSYRAPTGLSEHRVLNSEGLRGRDGHGEPARWMDFSSEGPKGAWSGVTIFDHPENPRHPTPWYVYTDKMAYMGPAVLFNDPLTLAPGDSFTLRYRVFVHNGSIAPSTLDKQWKDYVNLTDTGPRNLNN